MISWVEFRERVRRLKAARRADILASEPPGRRPRDPEQEALLAERERERVAPGEFLSAARRRPVRPGE